MTLLNKRVATIMNQTRIEIKKNKSQRVLGTVWFGNLGNKLVSDLKCQISRSDTENEGEKDGYE